MSRKRKVYTPVLDNDKHLVSSRKTPGRVRGLSQDSDNKNTDIPEWEEEEINEVTHGDDVLKGLGWFAILCAGYKIYRYIKNRYIHRTSDGHSESDEGHDDNTVGTDATDLIDRFETVYEEDDLTKTEIQRLLLENYFMALKIAMNNRRLAEGGIHIDNKRLFEFVENKEICNKLTGFLNENRKSLGDDIWNDYYSVFKDNSNKKDRIRISPSIVHSMIEDSVGG